MRLFREITRREEVDGIVATYNHAVGGESRCNECVEEFKSGDIILVGEYQECMYAAHTACLVVEP